LRDFAAGPLQLGALVRAGLALLYAPTSGSSPVTLLFLNRHSEFVVGVGDSRKIGLGVGSEGPGRGGKCPSSDVFAAAANIIESYLVWRRITVMAPGASAGCARWIAQLVDAKVRVTRQAFPEGLTETRAVSLRGAKGRTTILRTVGVIPAFGTADGLRHRLQFIGALGRCSVIVKTMYAGGPRTYRGR